MIRELLATFCVISLSSGQFFGNAGWNRGHGVWNAGHQWGSSHDMTGWNSEDEMDDVRATCSFVQSERKYQIDGKITIKRQSNAWYGSRPELTIDLKVTGKVPLSLKLKAVITEFANIDGNPMCTPDNLGDVVQRRNNRHKFAWGEMASMSDGAIDVHVGAHDVFKESYTDIPITSVKDAFGRGFALCDGIESDKDEHSSTAMGHPWNMPWGHTQTRSRCSGPVYGCCKFGRSDKDAVEPKQC